MVNPNLVQSRTKTPKESARLS